MAAATDRPPCPAAAAAAAAGGPAGLAQPCRPTGWRWLRSLFAPRGRRGIVPGATSATAPEAAAGPGQRGPRHLIVLVNGLFGSSSNWEVVCEQLQQQLGTEQTLLHPSTANARFDTYDGIDTCGSRLADEVRQVAAAAPSLRRISFVSHSMGGLIARHALGSLFNPVTGRVVGLEPAHFVSLASPHCGCDADGMAQVPFIGWTESLPLLGQQLLRLLQDISRPTARLIFRSTGRQFFMLDFEEQGLEDSSSTARLPVLLQMTQDCPDRGLFFFSALSAFKTRTCYANMDGDHLVGWANSSLRALDGLPPLPPAATSAKGVVLEDPLSAAFYKHSWQQLQQQLLQQEKTQPVLPAAAAAALLQPHRPSRAWTDEGADADSRTSVKQQQQQQQQQPGWHELDPDVTAGSSSMQGSTAFGANWVPVQQQQQANVAATVAAAELEAAGAAAAATAAASAASATASGQPATAGRGQPQQPGVSDLSSPAGCADGLLQLAELPAAATGAAATNAASDASAAAATAAAGVDLSSGLAGGPGEKAAAAAAAATADAAVDSVAADVSLLAAQAASGCGASRAQLVSHMLHRLQELPWRRIDVSFMGARFGFAHNNIQVTRRWLNFEGKAVPAHLAQQLHITDQLLLAAEATAGSEAMDQQAAAAGG